MKLIIIASVLVLSITAVGFMQSRDRLDSPVYKVVSTDGAFEIRDYSESTLVSAPMDGPGLQNNSAFQKLFGYISGSNEGGEKIAMTTPVYSTRNENGGWMSFVVPNDVAKNGTPPPNSKELRVEKMAAGRFIVYRFSGSPSRSRFENARKLLAERIKLKGLKISGDYITAGYDPPFTPPSSRRNEVMIRLEK